MLRVMCHRRGGWGFETTENDYFILLKLILKFTNKLEPGLIAANSQNKCNERSEECNISQKAEG